MNIAVGTGRILLMKGIDTVFSLITFYPIVPASASELRRYDLAGNRVGNLLPAELKHFGSDETLHIGR